MHRTSYIVYPFQLSLLREMELLTLHLHCHTLENSEWYTTVLYNVHQTEYKQMMMMKKSSFNCMFVACITLCVLCVLFTMSCQLLERHVTNILLLNYSLEWYSVHASLIYLAIVRQTHEVYWGWEIGKQFVRHPLPLFFFASPTNQLEHTRTLFKSIVKMAKVNVNAHNWENAMRMLPFSLSSSGNNVVTVAVVAVDSLYPSIVWTSCKFDEV